MNIYTKMDLLKKINIPEEYTAHITEFNYKKWDNSEDIYANIPDYGEEHIGKIHDFGFNISYKFDGQLVAVERKFYCEHDLNFSEGDGLFPARSDPDKFADIDEIKIIGAKDTQIYSDGDGYYIMRDEEEISEDDIVWLLDQCLANM